MTIPPPWLSTLAAVSLAAAVVSALVVAADIAAGSRQQMWIMNIVWPLTALWSGPLGLCGYFAVGRLSTAERARRAKARDEKPPASGLRRRRAGPARL